MPIPAKKGTYNNAGGQSIMGAESVIIQGRAASRVGDYVTGHPYLHPSNPIAWGSNTVIIEGRRASRKGDYVTGHPYLHPANPIVLASRSVIIEGRPQGFLGSFDACGHIMIPTESDVLVGM